MDVYIVLVAYVAVGMYCGNEEPLKMQKKFRNNQFEKKMQVAANV